MLWLAGPDALNAAEVMETFVGDVGTFGGSREREITVEAANTMKIRNVMCGTLSVSMPPRSKKLER